MFVSLEQESACVRHSLCGHTRMEYILKACLLLQLDRMQFPVPSMYVSSLHKQSKSPSLQDEVGSASVMQVT